MTKEVIYKDLNLGDRFNVAFPDNRIPANSNTNKKKTRLGITYTCFKDKRNFIAVLPSVAIIEDALIDPEYVDLKLFPVKEHVTPEMVKEYLESDAEYKRILTTPESFEKIITAAKDRLTWLHKNFFIYLDEVHCYATEAFRDDILKPFEHFWNFDNKAVGTATYFPFSDPRFKSLQPYEMRYTEKFGKITIVNYHSPRAVLNHLLTHPEEFPGRVHIFFNTVTECGEAIRTAGIEDVNIYCRNDERNMINLDDMKVHFRPQPIQEEYKKFNFYSCRYNDGWNLRDDETATMVLVTDTSIPHSLIGIPYKGFQAVGRLMVKPHKIYHVTNNFGKEGMKSLEEIQTKWHYNAEKHIDYYNQHIESCAIDKMEDNGLLKELVKPFAKFKGDKAEKHPYKVDQFACAEFCKEHYNSLNTIRQTWESLNYETELAKFDIEPIKPSKRLAVVNKQVIERWRFRRC